MIQSIRVKQFFTSEQGLLIRKELEGMMKDVRFNTKSTYSPTSTEDLLFVDKHMNYLSQHPAVNHQHYLSNLKLMTRISS